MTTVRTLQRELTGKNRGWMLLESNMALTSRRQFAQQTAFASAALCGRPIKALSGTRLLEAGEQNAAPLDVAAIRRLASEIIMDAVFRSAATQGTRRCN
jgi:hypothetical protein